MIPHPKNTSALLLSRKAAESSFFTKEAPT